MPAVQVWRVTPNGRRSIRLDDHSSLDAITRRLPNGYYSTFRTYAGGARVLGLSAHLRRLYEPVSSPEVDEISLRQEMRRLLEAYRPHEGRVRAVMTQEGQLFIAVEPLKPLPQDVYENGVRVETTELQREHPQLKSTSFIARSDAERRHIAHEGIFEALLVRDGKILEGMTSNFFYILRTSTPPAQNARAGQEAILCTAGDDILPGVTRQTVIDIARGRGLRVKYKLLEQSQLAAAREAFITSSSRGIVPVVEIDDVRVGEGRPGPITRQLMNAYESYVGEHAEPI